MTNEVTNWQEKLAADAKQIAAQERPAASRISLKGGIMTYMNQPVRGNSLEVIILGGIVEHAYYPGRYDPNKIEAPDCFAFGTGEEGEDMAPHEKSYKPQATTCAECPLFQWGSDANSPSKKGKACKERRKLVFMPADAIKEGSNIAKAELATVDTPVTSVAVWKNYVNYLSNTEARPPWAVVTKLSLVPDPRTQIKLVFEHLFNIGDSSLGALHSRIPAAVELLQVPYEKTEAGLSAKTEAQMSGRKY